MDLPQHLEENLLLPPPCGGGLRRGSLPPLRRGSAEGVCGGVLRRGSAEGSAEGGLLGHRPSRTYFL